MAQHPLRRRRAEPPAGECPRVVTASACGHGPGLRLRAARCPQGEEQAAGCESAVGGRGAAPGDHLAAMTGSLGTPTPSV